MIEEINDQGDLIKVYDGNNAISFFRVSGNLRLQ